MTATNDNNLNPSVAVAAAMPWRKFLLAEEARLDALGLGAGLIALEIAASAHKQRIIRKRILRLLRVALPTPGDFGVLSPTRLGVLYAPVDSFTELVASVDRLDRQLREGKFDVMIGFAHRRSGEPLVHTLARADAELDRAIFRTQHGDDGLTLG